VRKYTQVDSIIVYATTLGTNAFHRRSLGKRSAVLQWALWGNGGPIAELEITTMRKVAPTMERDVAAEQGESLPRYGPPSGWTGRSLIWITMGDEGRYFPIPNRRRG
jgi:hypothetical protein